MIQTLPIKYARVLLVVSTYFLASSFLRARPYPSITVISASEIDIRGNNKVILSDSCSIWEYYSVSPPAGQTVSWTVESLVNGDTLQSDANSIGVLRVLWEKAGEFTISATATDISNGVTNSSSLIVKVHFTDDIDVIGSMSSDFTTLTADFEEDSLQLIDQLWTTVPAGQSSTNIPATFDLVSAGTVDSLFLQLAHATPMHLHTSRSDYRLNQDCAKELILQGPVTQDTSLRSRQVLLVGEIRSPATAELRAQQEVRLAPGAVVAYGSRLKVIMEACPILE